MAVKETLVMVRANTSVLWPFEVIEDSYVGQSPTSQTSSLSKDNLTRTSVRMWEDGVFISEKTNQDNRSNDLEYFTYVVENKIKIVRTYEVV